MNRLKQAKTSHRRSALSVALYSAGIFGALAAVPNAYAVPMTGLVFNGTQIVTFDTATPATTSAPINVTGMFPFEILVAIDFRPSDGLLYGITQIGQIYTIAAGGAVTLARDADTDFIDDAGFYGFDFNPVIDQLRLTSTTSPSNRRIIIGDSNDATGVNNDVNLSYAPADPNAGDTPAVDASAYTNSFLPSPRNAPPMGPGTTLFGIDTGQAAGADVLVTHGAPTNSVLTTRGPLGVNASTLTGFDIVGNSTAFMSTVPGDVSGSDGSFQASLYTINLATGAATLVGLIGPTGAGQVRVIGIAATIQAAPAPTTIQFGAATFAVTEGTANAAITVTRTGADNTAAATVQLAVVTGGTATAGSDFTAPAATVTIPANANSATVMIPITNDTAAEPSETVNLALSLPTPATNGNALGTPATAVLTIADNDGGAPPPPPPPAPAPAPTDDDDGGCTVNPNGKDAGLLALLLGGALAALRRRMKR